MGPHALIMIKMTIRFLSKLIIGRIFVKRAFYVIACV